MWFFYPKNAGQDFEVRFSEDAQWVLQLSYVDLAPNYTSVFTTQFTTLKPTLLRIPQPIRLTL
jgi:hypothetical protein